MDKDELRNVLEKVGDKEGDEELATKAKGCCPNAIDAHAYASRVLAHGAHTPNWIYWHGKSRVEARFAFRVHRRSDAEWNTAQVMPGFDLVGGEETSIWKSADEAFEWKYILVRGTNNDALALKALIAYLSNQVVSYGREVPHYGAYVKGLLA